MKSILPTLNRILHDRGRAPNGLRMAGTLAVLAGLALTVEIPVATADVTAARGMATSLSADEAKAMDPAATEVTARSYLGAMARLNPAEADTLKALLMEEVAKKRVAVEKLRQAHAVPEADAANALQALDEVSGTGGPAGRRAPGATDLERAESTLGLASRDLNVAIMTEHDEMTRGHLDDEAYPTPGMR